MSNFELSIHYFLQLVVILGACRVVGRLGRFLGQPQVVGEMITGVLLGPSLFLPLTEIWPAAGQAQRFLFPTGTPSMTIIYAVAQVGLVLYMFVVGLEFRTDILRGRAAAAASISIAGMLVPFALGAAIAVHFQKQGGFFTENVSTGQAMLFTAASMAITAFPMLARIIYERGLTGTRVGTLSLGAGCIDDACAWCVLAVVLASFRSDPKIAVYAIGGGALYVVFVLTVGRKLLAMLGRRVEQAGRMSVDVFAIVIITLMLGAWFTDFVGIYAVFGAFVLGIAMPRGLFAEELERRIEPLTTNLLLPMFFVYSGLNTRIDLLSSTTALTAAALVLAAACLGKFGACFVAAKLHRETTRDSAVIGALMNSRGLMELIILNIGLERGLITPLFFSIMVLMAVVTTLMATPAFELAMKGRGRPEPAPA